MNIWCFSRMMHATSEKFEYACDLHRKKKFLRYSTIFKWSKGLLKKSIWASPKHFTTGLALFYFQERYIQYLFHLFKKCKNKLISTGANSSKHI